MLIGLGVRRTGDADDELPASPFALELAVAVGRAIGAGLVIGPGLLAGALSSGTDARRPAPGASIGDGSEVEGVGARGVLGLEVGGPIGEGTEDDERLFIFGLTPSGGPLLKELGSNGGPGGNRGIGD